MFRRFVFWSLVTACSLAPSFAAAQPLPVTIAWDANTEPGVVGYRVYVGTSPAVYSQVFDAGATTQFTFSNGVVGQRYYFAVSAYAAGPLEGPRSSEVSAVIGGSTGGGSTGGSTGGSPGGTTGGSSGGSTSGGSSSGGGSGAVTGGGTTTPTPPVTPSEPVGPAVVLQPALVNGGMVSLFWNPVGGLVATEYVLEAGTAAGLSNLYNASVGGTLSLSAQVGPGAYYVRVRGRGLDGSITGPSNEVSFLVGSGGQSACSAPPTPPTGVVGGVNGGQASVRWVPAAGATSYLVQAGSAPGLSDIYYGNVGSLASVAAQVQPGFMAYVRVVAVNGCGQSGASTEIVVQ